MKWRVVDEFDNSTVFETSNLREALKKAEEVGIDSHFIYNTETQTMQYWDGAKWVSEGDDRTTQLIY